MKNKELHKIAPTLSKLKKKGTGFNVPNNYFNTIEEHLINEFTIRNSTKNTSKVAFNTPENYFETIEENVFQKLKEKEKQTNVISIKQRLAKIWIPIVAAASILLVFTLTTNSNNTSFESIATAEIENWIENGQVDIDAYQLASIYNDIEIDDSFIHETISDNDLMDYLNEENIEQLILEN